MPGFDLVLRFLGVVRSVLGVGGRYRAAQLIGLSIAVGWFLYTYAGEFTGPRAFSFADAGAFARSVLGTGTDSD